MRGPWGAVDDRWLPLAKRGRPRQEAFLTKHGAVWWLTLGDLIVAELPECDRKAANKILREIVFKGTQMYLPEGVKHPSGKTVINLQ